MAGTPTAEEVGLLCLAARFQRGSNEFEKEDLAFRSFAVEAIVASHGNAAYEGVLALIARVRDKVRGYPLWRLYSNIPPTVCWKLSRVARMPRGRAIYRLAHEYQGKGGIAAKLSSTIGRWRYRKVFNDLKKIAH